MKKKYTFIVFLSVFWLFYSVQAFASRAYAPAKISPVIYKDIRIVAENSSPENMGVVQAFEVTTNKLIWSKKVYEVKIKPNVEEDTQLVFIKELKIENDKLVVINENSKKYILDPNTGKDLNNKSNLIISIVLIIVVIMVSFMALRNRRKPIH